MAISNSYVKLPEGNYFIVYTSVFEHQHWLAIHAKKIMMDFQWENINLMAQQ